MSVRKKECVEHLVDKGEELMEKNANLFIDVGKKIAEKVAVF